MMAELCIWCGAQLPKKMSCQAIHEEILNFEALHAIPHSIHFLHVTCFLIQHERYSSEGLKWAQSMLDTNLVEGITEQQHFQSLRMAENKRASGRRIWNFHRNADAPPLPKVAWSVTITDVYRQLHDAQAYSAHVKQWARATLQEMDLLEIGS